MNYTNAFGQTIGYPLLDWKEPAFPEAKVLEGDYCRLEPLNPDHHAAPLFAANSQDSGSMWTYMGCGPFQTLAAYESWMRASCQAKDPQFYAIIDKQKAQVLGLASYLRIDPKSGTIEVGHIAYSPPLQKTLVATEAMYLLMRNAFALGYRRYEWKCDALNQASCKAASRLGFSYEGCFRQATHYKGRNRDTAWFSVIDKDWPQLQSAFEQWLSSGNFDSQGQQKSSLSELTKALIQQKINLGYGA